MKSLLNILFFVAIYNKYCIADVELLPESQLDDLINSNKLLLAYISPREDCDDQCQKSSTVLKSVGHATSFLGLRVVHIYSPSLLKGLHSPDEPKLFYYRNGIPLIFEAETFEVEDISEWIADNQQVLLKQLDDDTFEHLTQASTGSTTGDWFILFYSKKCHHYLPLWETLGLRLKHHKVVAAVNTDDSPNLEKRFAIKSCPTALYFHGGKMYSYELPLNDITSMTNFAEGWYKNAPSRAVPSEHSPFDQLTGSMADWLKANPLGFVAVAGGFILLLLTIYRCRNILVKDKPKLF